MSTARPLPDLPLRDRCVLITRPEQDAHVLAEELRRCGARVLDVPTISICPPADVAPLERALRDLSQYDWIIFTSRHAVQAVFTSIPDATRSVGLPTGLSVAAVGRSTQQELESHGATVRCVAPDQTAASLAMALTDIGLRGSRVLIPQSELAEPALSTSLRSAGATVDAVTAYRTMQTSPDPALLEPIRAGKVDIIVLGSPSAARNLVDLVGPESVLQRARVACIGPTTANAAAKLGFLVASVAQERTIASLVEATIQAASGVNHEPG